MQIESGTIPSRSGEAIAYDLYLPAGSPKRAVLLCQGLSGDKSLVLPTVAKAFAEVGLVSLAFDYRGFGESEGQRGWVDPFARLDDAHSAFDWLEIRFATPAVYGLSLGGGIAYALGSERCSHAVAVTSGFASGEKLLRGLRSASEWLALKASLNIDEMVPISEIFPFSAKFMEEYRSLPRESGGPSSSSIPATPLFHRASANLLRRFNVMPSVGRISPTPLLIQHGNLDDVIPIEDVLEIYRAADEPKKLIIHEGYDHVGLDNGPGLEAQITAAIEWLTQ